MPGSIASGTQCSSFVVALVANLLPDLKCLLVRSRRRDSVLSFSCASRYRETVIAPAVVAYGHIVLCVGAVRSCKVLM